MSEKRRREFKRINNISADLRQRQGEAAAISKRNNRSSDSTGGKITDLTEEAFVEEAKSNGLDLAALAAEVAAEKEVEETKKAS